MESVGDASVPVRIPVTDNGTVVRGNDPVSLVRHSVAVAVYRREILVFHISRIRRFPDMRRIVNDSIL